MARPTHTHALPPPRSFARRPSAPSSPSCHMILAHSPSNPPFPNFPTHTHALSLLRPTPLPRWVPRCAPRPPPAPRGGGLGQENRRAARVIMPNPALTRAQWRRQGESRKPAPTTCLVGGGRMEEGGWGGDACGESRRRANEFSFNPSTNPSTARWIWKVRAPTNGGAPTMYGSCSLTVRCVARARGGSSCGAAPRE